jgi:hypothetical protein
MRNDGYEVFLSNVRKASDAPRGPDIFYCCGLCGGIISSQPNANVGCECGNMFLDDDYHRFDLNDWKGFLVLRRVKE